MNIQPDWLDERIHLDEVPKNMAEEADVRRARGFEATRAALTESDKRILLELPSDRFASEVERRRQTGLRLELARKPNRAPLRTIWGGSALAACIALFFAIEPIRTPAPVVSESASPLTPPADNGTSSPIAFANPRPVAVATETGHTPQIRTKGSVSLVIQRETADGLAAVSESDSLGAGVRLRLSVPDSLAWAAIYSLDSRGEMAQHWPLQGEHASALPQGQLPRVWELDDAIGNETFVLVWAQRPFQLDKIRKAVFLNRSKPKLESWLEVRVVQIRKSVGPTR